MKKIQNLIRADLITMNGGKNNLKMVLVLMFLIIGVLGFLFSPLFGLYCPLFVSGFFVHMLFQNEMKFHCEKMYSLLPIKRRDLVLARFLLTTLLYSVLFLMFYLMMLLALYLKPYYLMMGDDAEMMDIIGLVVGASGSSFTELGFFNLLYFAVYSLGLIVSTSSLRKYFRDSERFQAGFGSGKMIKKASKEEIGLGIFILAVVCLWVLIVTDVLPITTAILPILQLIMQLAQVANGFLFGVVVVAIAWISTVYKYICTVLEYDVKEL